MARRVPDGKHESLAKANPWLATLLGDDEQPGLALATVVEAQGGEMLSEVIPARREADAESRPRLRGHFTPLEIVAGDLGVRRLAELGLKELGSRVVDLPE